MNKDLAYFKNFLDNPASFKVSEFYVMLRDWAEYIRTHKDEFNYLEDEEWREIRERVIAAFNLKEKLTQEFDEIGLKFDMVESGSDEDHIAVIKEWLAFMKKNQAEYDFPDENIAVMEAKLNNLVTSVLNSKIANAKLRESEIQVEKSLEKLDDAIFEHYERTGKRPVLTALRVNKNLKGN